jgi:hypothetical protein
LLFAIKKINYTFATMQIKESKYLKKKLQFVQSLKVDYEPWVMKLSNSIMFVQSGNSHYYYTYDLDNLTLFYYENEKFKEELALNNNLIVYCFGVLDGLIIQLNGKVLITNYNGKQIIRYSRD